ncbi:MAG: SOS response-associated peptidase [Eubacteriaceae bacterium]|nr:SOS response-associated peptidase [Eubacteriaceae bacterium]
MCGRFTGFSIDDTRDIISVIKSSDMANSEGLAVDAKFEGEVFPSDIVPVLVPSKQGEEEVISAKAMKWGYPLFANHGKILAKPRLVINAKAETAASLQMWRESVATRRCIVPSNGFYEWQKNRGGKRIKLLFNTSGKKALFMAAIYKEFAYNGCPKIAHFSILTTEANESICHVHNRMPVVLLPGEFDDWFGDNWADLFDRSLLELDNAAV